VSTNEGRQRGYPVSGKVALVTGAARGIGFETAKALHQRGASVAVLDLGEELARRACDQIGERTLPLVADVTDPASMQRAVAETVARCGRLDVAVANAGVAPPMQPMTTIGTEAFERVIEVNLLGVWRTIHAVLPEVVRHRGHVVVVSSVAAFAPGALSSPYAASKAGVEQLGRALRAELAVHGASAGVAYFGFIDTDMVRDAFDGTDPVAAQVQRLFPRIVRRRQTPERAASVVVAGIERRAARTITPRYWQAYSMLRGILNPLIDRSMARDVRLQQAIAETEARGR
jgi:NAD(P)-dependent dehydrogenase (short-subunit alcohol dehydrogenase family)